MSGYKEIDWRPWDPPEVSRLCTCIVCGDVYQSVELEYDEDTDRYRCRNHPDCQGEGWGYHIFACFDEWGRDS